MEDGPVASPPGRLYARARREAYLYAGAVGEYSGRAVRVGELRTRLDIGRPEY